MIVEYMEIKDTQRYYEMKYTSKFEMNIGQIYGRAIDLYERSKLFDKNYIHSSSFKFATRHLCIEILLSDAEDCEDKK